MVMPMLTLSGLEISRVQQEIIEVEAEIKIASNNILSPPNEPRLSVEYWIRKEGDLRKKQLALRKKQLALMAKKQILLEQMSAVMSEPDIQTGTFMSKLLS